MIATVIRRGDIWDLRTNHGILRRSVRSVACGVVSYMDCSGKLCRCSVEAFRRWCRAAELASADDWTGRDMGRL